MLMSMIGQQPSPPVPVLEFRTSLIDPLPFFPSLDIKQTVFMIHPASVPAAVSYFLPFFSIHLQPSAFLLPSFQSGTVIEP